MTGRRAMLGGRFAQVAKTVTTNERTSSEMRTYLKTLGLALLAFVAMTAVSASPAQARWELLRNGKSVNLLNLNVSMNETDLLIPGWGIEIHCTGGEGTAHLELGGSSTTLNASIQNAFHECYDSNFFEVCTIHSVGQPNGVITAGTTGQATMQGATVLLSTGSSEVSNYIYLGEECPLMGLSLTTSLSGTLTTEISNPSTNTSSHQISLVEQNIYYQEASAEFHSGGSPLTGSLSEATGDTFAVHLVDL